jgi:hypothetical protein
MHSHMIQELARVQLADQLLQAERSRLVRQVREARSPRPRLVAGRRFQWPNPWFPRPRGPRTA